MLAKARRRVAHSDRRIAEMNGGADNSQLADHRMIHIQQHIVDCRLRIIQRLPERTHRGAEQILFLQAFEPMGGCVGRKILAEEILQERLVFALRGEIRIFA